MPILSFQIDQAGPIINAAIGVSAPRIMALQKAGLAVPPPVIVRALLDTGASCTCIDSAVIAKLGILPSGIVQVHTPSTGGTPRSCNQFDVSLFVLMDGNQVHVPSSVIPVIESDLSQQGIQALIGRDVLNQGVLHYDGLQHCATLAF
jgi:hypothetical protein